MLSCRSALAVALQLAAECRQFVAGGKKNQRAILIDREDCETDLVPFLLEQRPTHLDPQDQRGIDSIGASPTLLNRNCLIELLP